jgi:diguanylate cyclase (GGDEF)-like protein
VIGKAMGQEPLVRRILSERNGASWGVSPLNGFSKLYVWRNSGQQLLVVVGKPAANIYGLWQKQAMRIGGVMLALICFVAAVTLFLAREISRRARAEDKLEELATTDALTGLRNRRKFNTVLALEWRRAVRQSTPLALLLIDADHFKAFNDTFGHQPGDQALTSIAGCMAGSANRAADCAARYGGEEFALLLPGMTVHDASKVAERSSDCETARPGSLSASASQA